MILGKPAAWRLDPGRAAGAVLTIEEETLLHEEPTTGAEVIGSAAPGRYPIWERGHGWIRILVGDLAGWVRTQPSPTVPELEFFDEVVPSPLADPTVARVPRKGLEAQTLERALDLLGRSEVERTLGDFRLLTDLEAPRLETFLEAVAAAVPEIYRQRYELDGVIPENATIVVYRDLDDYLSTRELVELDPDEHVAGFAVGAVAVLHARGRSREDLARTLIHELTHVLDSAWLRPPPIAGDSPDYLELPPWLEEGLAENLALSWVDRKGGIHADRLARGVLRSPRTVRISGRSLQMLELLQAIDRDRIAPLTELLRMERAYFLAPEVRSVNYLQSATLVRFLLAEEDLRGVFLRFLSDVSRHRVSGWEFADRLEDTADIEARYRRWTRSLVEREAL